MNDMPLNADQIRIIQAEMAGLSGRQAKSCARLLAQQFGCDVSRVYYHSKTVRPARGRRKDAGKPRVLDPQTLESLAYYTVNMDFSSQHVTDVAQANGLGEISRATYNRHLRKLGIGRRQNQTDIRPFIKWQAKFPNQLHQLDSTVSQQFYIDDDDSIGFESTLTKNKNKPGNKKPRLHLLALVDDFSRTVFAQFTLGNHTFAWMNFLYQAWKVKEDAAGFPFHGLPVILYSDNDAVVGSGKFTLAMQALGVKVISHKVGNPRAKGKVESAFPLLQEFEKVTKVRNWKSVAEANQDLMDYLYFINNRVHSVTKRRPLELWTSIPNIRLKAVPQEEIFARLHMEQMRRKVNKDMTISLPGGPWHLPIRPPFVNYVGQMIEFYRAPNISDKIWLILDGKEYEVSYLGERMRGVGRHEELPKPEALQRREALQAKDDPGLKLTGIYAGMYRRPYLFAKHAQAFDKERIGGAPLDPVRTKFWFVGECQSELGFAAPPLPAEKEWMDAIFGENPELPESQLRNAINRLKSGEEIVYQRQAVAGA